MSVEDMVSNLEQHARHEVQLAGLFDKDSDYDGMLGDAVMGLIMIKPGSTPLRIQHLSNHLNMNVWQ